MNVNIYEVIAATSICGPLSRLYQNSINSGVYPNTWKLANVSALHKKGSVYDCNNYRPISPLSCISKVFEKFVFNRNYAYLTANNLISPSQAGFRLGDSTVRQLVSICHRISKALDDGDEMLSVFIDFPKRLIKSGTRDCCLSSTELAYKGHCINGYPVICLTDSNVW